MKQKKCAKADSKDITGIFFELSWQQGNSVPGEYQGYKPKAMSPGTSPVPMDTWKYSNQVSSSDYL
jgi:hypothetical protein